jgi:hypothetical protein
MTEAEVAAQRQGRSEGLAFGAVALGIVAFINLLGAEKGILAAALGVLARRHATSNPARRRGAVAITLGVVQLATIMVVLALFRDRIGELLDLLKTLG